MSKEENFMLLKIQTIVLKVHIHCEGCKKKVKKLLQKVEGVYTSDIDAEQQKVTVTGNIDSDTLIKKLLKSGKHAELWPASGKGNQQKQQNEQKPRKVQFDLSDQKPFKGQEAKDQKPQKGINKGTVDWFDDDFELKEWKDKVNGCDGKKGGAGGGGGGDNGGGKKGGGGGGVGGGGDNGGVKKGAGGGGGGGGENVGGKKGGGGGDGQNKGGGGGDGGKKGGGGDGQNKAAGGGGNEGKNNGGGKKSGGGGNPNQNGGGGKKDGGDNQNGGKKNGGGDGGDNQSGGGGGGGGGEANRNGGGGGGGGGKKGGKKGGNGDCDGEGSTMNGYGDDGDCNNTHVFGVGNGVGGGLGVGVGGGIGCTCHGGAAGGYEYPPTNFHPAYRGNVNERYMMMAYRPQYPMPYPQHNPADYATHLFSDENTSGCSIM